MRAVADGALAAVERARQRGGSPELPFEAVLAVADSLLGRYLDETGEYPASVGLSVWGTSAMRTSGDDVAEVLAGPELPRLLVLAAGIKDAAAEFRE